MWTYYHSPEPSTAKFSQVFKNIRLFHNVLCTLLSINKVKPVFSLPKMVQFWLKFYNSFFNSPRSFLGNVQAYKHKTKKRMNDGHPLSIARSRLNCVCVRLRNFSSITLQCILIIICLSNTISIVRSEISLKVQFFKP